MGKIFAGILSAPSGKISGVVGASWKGINYLRGYAIPSNPNTTAQQEQRSKFSLAQELASAFLNTVVQPFWDFFARGVSGYNNFVSANLLSFHLPPDYDRAVMSAGKLEGTTSFTSVYDSGTGALDSAWTGTHLSNGLDTDIVVIVAYDSQNKIGFVDSTSFTRVDANSTLNIGAGRVDANIKTWIFFYRDLGTQDFIVSPSSFAQAT